MTSNGPERMCIGCRRRAPQAGLVRFVADERGHVRADVLRCRAGRGAYLCPQRRCLEQAAGRGAFARALRRRVAPVDAAALATHAGEALHAARRGLLEQALRDGRAAPGVATDGATAPQIKEAKLQRHLDALADHVRLLEG